jgi:hypothetical protein
VQDTPKNVAQARLPTAFVVAVLLTTAIPTALTVLGLQVGISEQSAGALHVVLESFAGSTALLISFVAFFQLASAQREPTMAIIGPVFFFSGTLDLLHALGSVRPFPSLQQQHLFLELTWTLSRGYNAAGLLFGAAVVAYREPPRANLRWFLRANALLGMMALVVMYLWSQSEVLPTPPRMQSVARPLDLLPLSLFVFTACFVTPRLYERQPSLLSHALMLSMIPQVAVQILMAFGAARTFDTAYFVAHGLKIMAYLLPLSGIAFDYVRTRAEEQLALERAERDRLILLEQLKELSLQITRRQDSEEALVQQVARTRLHLDVAAAANRARSTEEALRTVLERVCHFAGWPVGHVFVQENSHLGSSRVWYIEDPVRFAAFRDATERLSLESGVGLPGEVLATRTPAWIPDISVANNFPRKRVALDAGLVSASSYPVLVEQKVVAVVEFFSPRPQQLDHRMLDVMAHVCVQLGGVFERQRLMSLVAPGSQSK